MAFDEKELEDKLLGAGNKLADPPSSVEELLPLLDRVESYLSRVEQAPSNSMLIALAPSLKALVGDKLLRHSDPDVKVALASCFSELTRITAPEAPYDDDQMKGIFQLVVSSFENIHDRSSRSYSKRKAILETVAKVRSCVVMLDLECDALILEMFQHFMKGIREHHSGKVFSSMDTIMTLVLEESEDISFDLLSPLLNSIKKDNEDVSPVARKLGEKVLERCATKLKPYLVQAVRTLGISVDDYNKVLASICQETSDSLEKNGVCVTGERMEDKGKSAKLSPEESTQVVNEEAKGAAQLSQDNRDRNRTTKSVRNNGVAYAAEDDDLADANSIKKKKDTNCSGSSKGLRISGHEELNDLDEGKADKNELKPKQATKKSRRKSSYSIKSAKPSECQVVASEKASEKMMDSESHIKEVLSSPHEDKFVGKNEEIRAKISLPKARNNESEVVAAPSPSDSLPDENHLKKLGKAKSKDSPANVEGTDASSKKVSEGASISEAKPVERSVRKVLGRSSGVKNTAERDSSKKQSGADSGADAKKHSAKKLDDNEGGGTSSRQLVDKKKSGRGEANSGPVAAKSSTLDVDKKMVSSPTSAAKSSEDEKLEETTKRSSKRKHTSGRKNESEKKGYDEKLVGVRVEVWWPKDRQYYKGVIESFDSAKKKHKVLYDDGEVEVLNLLREKWKITKADSVPDREEGNNHASLDASTEMPPRKKVKKSAGEQKEGKLGLFSSGGATGSSKSKGESMKSGQKSKDVNKSKESKTIGESEDEGSRELNDSTLKSGSSKSAAQKMTSSSKTSNSKDENTITPKLFVKSKQETPRGGTSKLKIPKIAASEGKPLKSGEKSTADGGSKLKSVTLKKNDLENDDSDVSASEEEDTKGKKPVSSKTAASEGKSVGKFTADGGGKVKSFSLKKKDLENDDSDVSASEAEDTKGKKSVSSKTAASEGKPRKSVGKSTTDGGGKVKVFSLKKKDLENDDTDVSESEAKDTKGKTSVSSKPAASEGKPPKIGGKSTADCGGRVISFSLKKINLENEDSDISASEMEDTKGKASVSSKAQGSEAKRGKKRQRS